MCVWTLLFWRHQQEVIVNKMVFYLPTFSCAKFLKLRLLLVCGTPKSVNNKKKRKEKRCACGAEEGSGIWSGSDPDRLNAETDDWSRFLRSSGGFEVETPDGKEEGKITRRSWVNNKLSHCGRSLRIRYVLLWSINALICSISTRARSFWWNWSFLLSPRVD